MKNQNKKTGRYKESETLVNQCMVRVKGSTKGVNFGVFAEKGNINCGDFVRNRNESSRKVVNIRSV